MPDSFQYVALDSSGAEVRGEIAARSRLEAMTALSRRMLQPLSVSADGQAPPPRGSAAGGPGAKAEEKRIELRTSDIINFTEELADLLDAGLQLDPALKIMESKSGASRVGRAAGRLRLLVVEGTPLSRALPAVSKRFDGLYSSLVAAGEASGSLEFILRKQSAYLTIMQDLRAKVVQALIYPSFIFAAGIILIVIFMTVLVPQLTMLFSKGSSAMPLPTKLLIGASQFLGSYGWLLAIAAAVLVAAAIFFVSRPRGKVVWHRMKLRLPLLGGVLEASFYAQCAHTLSNVMANGIPLLNALKLVNSATGNLHLRTIWNGIIHRVAEGASLSKALAGSKAFPADFTDLVAVGEQTGNLAGALGKAAIRFDKILATRIQRITALIQPVVIFALALMVGLFAYSILAGIFQAVSGLKPGK